MNNDSWADYQAEIKKAEQEAIKKFDETCEKIAKNEPKVWLTIEEAKAVNETIAWLCSTLEDYEREHDNTPALIEGWNQMDFLEHRIEQAEKRNE